LDLQNSLLKLYRYLVKYIAWPFKNSMEVYISEDKLERCLDVKYGSF